MEVVLSVADQGASKGDGEIAVDQIAALMVWIVNLVEEPVQHLTETGQQNPVTVRGSGRGQGRSGEFREKIGTDAEDGKITAG